MDQLSLVFLITHFRKLCNKLLFVRWFFSQILQIRLNAEYNPVLFNTLDIIDANWRQREGIQTFWRYLSLSNNEIISLIFSHLQIGYIFEKTLYQENDCTNVFVFRTPRSVNLFMSFIKHVFHIS